MVTPFYGGARKRDVLQYPANYPHRLFSFSGIQYFLLGILFSMDLFQVNLSEHLNALSTPQSSLSDLFKHTPFSTKLRRTASEVVLFITYMRIISLPPSRLCSLPRVDL